MCDSCPRHNGYPCRHAGHCYDPDGLRWHALNYRHMRRIVLATLILVVYIGAFSTLALLLLS
jgi:hypothetical protein